MPSKQKKAPLTAAHRAAAAKTPAEAPAPYKPFWGASLDAREDAERQSCRNAGVARGTHWPFPLG